MPHAVFIKPGPSTVPVVFEHGGVRFGLTTCYDPRFPELARSLADAGAQICAGLVVLGGALTRRSSGLRPNAARAIENSVYVAPSQDGPASVLQLTAYSGTS
ncbi:hypothetical protein HC744_06065 [Arthrobacter sp. S1_S22]|nr:hypothetical protein [Arthrobacter sp. S1_S22]